LLKLDLRWQSLEGVGLEHCHVLETADGIAVRSSLVGEHDGSPSAGVKMPAATEADRFSTLSSLLLQG